MKRVLLSIMLLILGMTFVMIAQQPNTKVICYNILEGMVTDTTPGKHVFSEWIKSQDADIIGLQEVNDFTQESLTTLAGSYGHNDAVLCKEPGYPPALTSKSIMNNAERTYENMWHGFVFAEIDGYNVISLHLSPHQYSSRWKDIDLILQTIKSKGVFEKWIIMGDFNSISPLDKEKYKDGSYLKRLEENERKNPSHKNLMNGHLDYEVHQKILDFGFVDALRAAPDFSENLYTRRIDFIYVSPDLKDQIVSGGIISDDFTEKYSDHKPLYIILK